MKFDQRGGPIDASKMSIDNQSIRMSVNVQYHTRPGKAKNTTPQLHKRKGQEKGRGQKREKESEDESEEDEDVALFLNSAILQQDNQDYLDDPTKSYRTEIVRKLLEDFDLEKTMDKYRNMGSQEYSINPADFSLDR